jgi:hypothetical protein
MRPCRTTTRPGRPLLPPPSPTAPRVDPLSPPCAWPLPPPAPHARRPSVPALCGAAPACAWPAAGRTERQGEARTPRGRGESRGLASRAIVIIIVLLLSVACFVCYQASGFRLLLSVVLCVGVFLLLLCHAAFLFLSLFLSSVVSCACGFVCVAAVVFCCSCAGDGRPRPCGFGRRCVVDTDFEADDGILSTYYVQYLPVPPATCPRNRFPSELCRIAALCLLGMDFDAYDGEFCPFLRHSPVP